MTVSLVSPERCQLFTVIRTNKITGDRQILSYPPTDYMTSVKRAAAYQRNFDPAAENFYYRVHMVD